MKENFFLFLLGFVVVNGDITRVKVSQNEIATAPDLRSICENFENSANVSEICARELDIVCGNLTMFMTMLDASSKFPYSGLGFASKMDYGNFDQCMTIDHSYDDGKILGEHCTVGLLIPDLMDDIYDTSTYFRLSVCRPSGCYASDYNAIVQNLTSPNIPELFQDIMCQTVKSNRDFTASDIVTLTIFALFISLMFISTIYDIYLYQSQLKSHPLLSAFSVLSNGRKLLHISRHSESKEQIETFHGLRVISMMWIVAVHGISAWRAAAVTNRDTMDSWINQRYAGYISTGTIAVDTFFYMSGFLLAFQYLKSSKEKSFMEQVLSVPHMYIHRYLRLTPAMLMLYLTTISFFKHLGSGPLWPYNEDYAQNCRDNWWSLFLYIQNYFYYTYNNQCLPHTWYLSADMQMFLLSPFILIPSSVIMKKSWGFKMSMVELVVLNIFCTFMPMVLKFIFQDYTNEFDTHSRLINYFIGMMLGVFMREKINKPFLYMVKEHRRFTINLVTWIVILAGMLAVVICFHEVEMHGGYETQLVFDSLMRPAWCLGLSWITYSCYHGHGCIVNWILCRPIFQVLGRLTYCIYLLHGSVVVYYLISTRVPWFFNDYNAFYLFCGHYVVSIMIAIFWTLAFESPLIIVEKYLTGGRNRVTQSKPPAPTSENIVVAPRKDVVQNMLSEADAEEIEDAEKGGAYKRNSEIY